MYQNSEDHLFDQARTVSIGKLPNYVLKNEDRVITFLESKGCYGITSVSLVKQYAFVEFSNNEYACQAVQCCDGMFIEDQRIKVALVYPTQRTSALNPHPVVEHQRYDAPILISRKGFNIEPRELVANETDDVRELNDHRAPYRRHLLDEPRAERYPAIDGRREAFKGTPRSRQYRGATKKGSAAEKITQAYQRRGAHMNRLAPKQKTRNETYGGHWSILESGTRRSNLRSPDNAGSYPKKKDSRSLTKEDRNSRKKETRPCENTNEIDKKESKDKQDQKLKTPTAKPNNAAYGQLVGQRLDKMTDKQQAYAKVKIEEALFAAEFGFQVARVENSPVPVPGSTIRGPESVKTAHFLESGPNIVADPNYGSNSSMPIYDHHRSNYVHQSYLAREFSPISREGSNESIEFESAADHHGSFNRYRSKKRRITDLSPIKSTYLDKRYIL